MGKIEAAADIIHFSHPHPLFLKSIINTTKCSACEKQASGLMYSCDPCSYSLHKICSEMPEKLKHKADGEHALGLLAAPAYSTGSFQCDACGVVGRGFCYHCGECELDLHPACALARSSVKGGAHDHPLHLCLHPPYADRAFVCDVCGGTGSNHWLYRCEPCGFDAHLKCGRADKVRVRLQPPKADQRPHFSSSTSSHFSRSQSVGGPTTMYRHQPWHRPPVVYGGPTRNDAVQNVVNGVIEGFVQGAANQLGQAFIQGALGN